MKDQDQKSGSAQCDNDTAVLATKVKTMVYAFLEGGGPKYELIPDDDASADKFEDKNTIHFKEDTGVHEIEFRLVDSTRMGLRFAADAIWAEDNGTCPPKQGINSTQIFDPQPNGKKLTVSDRNDNQGPLTIAYQLNFVDRSGNRVPPFDPIIINDGGNRFD